MPSLVAMLSREGINNDFIASVLKLSILALLTPRSLLVDLLSKPLAAISFLSSQSEGPLADADVLSTPQIETRSKNFLARCIVLAR